MKILFVIHGPRDPFTAIFLDASERAESFRSRGHLADVLAPNDFSGLQRVPSRLWPLVYPFLVAVRLWSQRQIYDVVQFHSYSGWVFHLLNRFTTKGPKTLTAFQGLEPIYYDKLKVQAARNHAPLSWRFRIFQGWFMPRVLRFSCRRSDRVICLNRSEVRYLEDNRWATTEQLVLGENSVSEDFLIEREWPVIANRLMFLGQWLDMKGTCFLVDAFTILARTRPDLELWCVGTLAEKDAVLASFPAEVHNRVTVRSHVSRDELLECFRQADIFVLPTLSEGFNNALLEAMASGMPIVTTPVGAAPDILESEESVLFAPPADANALVESLDRLLSDAALRERLGRSAQVRARRYTVAESFRRFYEVVQDVLQAKHADLERESIIG